MQLERLNQQQFNTPSILPRQASYEVSAMADSKRETPDGQTLREIGNSHSIRFRKETQLKEDLLAVCEQERDSGPMPTPWSSPRFTWQ